MLADPEGNEFCVIEPGNNFLADCGFIGALACDGSQEVGYFWSEALGWPLVWDQDQETAIRSPHGGPKITWGGPPLMPRTGKNRLHFDLAPPLDGDQRAEVDRLSQPRGDPGRHRPGRGQLGGAGRSRRQRVLCPDPPLARPDQERSERSGPWACPRAPAPAGRRPRPPGGPTPGRSARPRPAARLATAWSRNSRGMPSSSTGVSTPSSRSSWAIAAPTPAVRTLSSTTATSRRPRASRHHAGGAGITHRGSTTVAEMPWSVRRFAASTQACAIAPTETTSTSPPSAVSRSQPSRRSTAGRSAGHRALRDSAARSARRRRRRPRAAPRAAARRRAARPAAGPAPPAGSTCPTCRCGSARRCR